MAENVTSLTEGPTSAGLTNELLVLVRATGVKYEGAPEPDGDEKIDVHVVPLAEVDAFLSKRVSMGEVVDPKVYAALYFARAS